MSKYFTWKKGVDLQISPHFNTSELECKCDFSDCEEQKINQDLLAKLEKVRAATGQSLFITSAFRCHKKQKQLRGSGIKTAVGTSTHELGDAVDVKARDMSKLLQALEVEFQSIGIAKTFIHCDMRPGYRRWDY